MSVVVGLCWSGAVKRMAVLSTYESYSSMALFCPACCCNSADINPIGGISKVDLRRFLRWAAAPQTMNYTALLEVIAAPPTAELEPITADYKQNDEQDMGMTYEELGIFGTRELIFV